MQEVLIKTGFLKWLESLDIAPYSVMFFDIPKFIQHSYIQKWLRETHNINVWVSSKTTDKGNTIFIPHGRTIPDTIVKGYVKDIIVYKTFDKWEEALEFALQEALKLIK
jgi:hypothetical protein